MKQLVVTVGFVYVLFLQPLSGYTQDEMELTVERSVAIALEKNPAIRMAEKERDKARAKVWEAVADLLPAVDASVNFQHAWEIQTNTIPNFLKPMLGPLAGMIPEFANMPDYVQLSFGLENTFTYGMRLTQPVFLGGAGIAGVGIARSAYQASEYQLEQKRQQLIFNTVNAFYGCLLARELVTVQEQALEQADANLEVVLKKYKAGSASGFDKMRAEVEVANLKPGVINARNNYQSALTGLRTVMGLPKETKVIVQGTLAFSSDEFDGVTLNDLQKRAMENRPELKAFAAQKRMASKGIAVARSQFLPKLFFATDYSFLAMRNDYHFREDDFSKGFTSALSLQVPLFQSFKRHKQYQRSKLDYRIVLDSERQIVDGIAAEVEIAYNKFQETKEKYIAARESIDLAEKSLHLANLMYEEGASTQLDVMNSQLALTRARLNYASALYEYQMARYELRRVTGTLKGVL